MDTLVVPDVEARGLAHGPLALSPSERDVFVVYDLQLYYEMEGSFFDHVQNDPEKMNWLEDTLIRAGDLGSLGIIRRLRELAPDATSEGDKLCAAYDERRQFRWECLEHYLSGQGVRLKWNRNDA